MTSKGNHVKFAPFVLCAISEIISKNMTSRFASFTEQDIEKIVEDKDLQNTKRLMKVAKELFADYMKEKKLREPEEKKALAQTLKTFNVKARKKKICSMYDKTIIRFQKNQVLSNGTPTSTLIILDITKTSSNACL